MAERVKITGHNKNPERFTGLVYPSDFGSYTSCVSICERIASCQRFDKMYRNNAISRDIKGEG